MYVDNKLFVEVLKIEYDKLYSMYNMYQYFINCTQNFHL